MYIQKFWMRISFLNRIFSPFAGRPSKSIKTNFAHKMAKIVVHAKVISMENYDEFITLDLPKIVICEIVSIESYYKVEEMKDSNYD